MPERATIFQTIQIGVESTPGTGVAANKRIQSMTIEPGPQVDVNTYRATGYKFPSVAAPSKEWTEASLGGTITYDEIVYMLSSVLNTAVISGASADKTWTFTPSTTGADTPKTFTIEQGSAVRAHKFAGAIVTELGMSFDRDACELSGTIIGAALQDAITMTAAPTALPLVPVLPSQVQVYLADTYAGLAGATALARALRVEWTLSDRYGPLWALNASTGWATTIETEPNLEITLLVEADAEGMGLLTQLRSGASKFIRIKALGGTLGSSNYALTLDQCVKVTDVSEFSDEDGVYAIEWTLTGAYDATWTKSVEAVVVCAQTTL